MTNLERLVNQMTDYGLAEYGRVLGPHMTAWRLTELRDTDQTLPEPITTRLSSIDAPADEVTAMAWRRIEQWTMDDFVAEILP